LTLWLKVLRGAIMLLLFAMVKAVLGLKHDAPRVCGASCESDEKQEKVFHAKAPGRVVILLCVFCGSALRLCVKVT